MILLTGFGPFRDVVDNPSAALVRAMDGRVVAGHRVVGLVLPVRYGVAPRLTALRAAALDPVLVVGFGVATQRDGVEVETVAHGRCEGEDVAGFVPPVDPIGPASVDATLDTARLAALLGAGLSQDAGAYVCNRWLYDVPRAVAAPAGFVHLPPAGLDPDLLGEALTHYLAG